MEPQTFSVLINGTVRIDGLSVRRADIYSKTMRILFSLPDSDEARRVRLGEPVCINFTCYDADTIGIAESISAHLLNWIFDLFRPENPQEKFNCSLDDYCHGLQIMSFLDMPCAHGLVGMVLDRCTVREVVQATLPLYPHFSRHLQSSLTTDLGRGFRTLFRPGDDSPVVPCRAVMSMILRGADFEDGFRGVRDSVLESLGSTRYRWGKKDIILARVTAESQSLPQDLIHLDDDTYLGFFFSFPECEVKPVGVFVLHRISGDTDLAFYERSQRLKGDRGWSRPRINNTERLYTLEPYCVVNENLYRDEEFVVRIFNALGTTLDQVGVSYRDSNKH